MKKKCSTCKETKDGQEFGKRKTSTDGLRCSCKVCEAKAAKEYREKNLEKVKASKAKYRENGGREKDREWARNNPDKVKANKARYRSNPVNHARELEYKKKYRKEHKEEIKEYNKQYWIKNQEKLKEYREQYCNENPERVKETRKKSVYKRLKNDPIFNRRDKVRKNLYKWVTRGGYKKTSNTELILGCTFEEFFIRAQALFLPGMTWENYGKVWDFDHIIPISYAMTEDEVNQLNCYVNLKPMYSEENRYIKRDNAFYNKYDLKYVLSEWI